MPERIAQEIESGTLVFDIRSDKVGEYRGQAGPYAMLRPVGGGREWEADPALVRPATQRERLYARVRAANARSGERGAGTGPGQDPVPAPPSPVPGCRTCADLSVCRYEARAVGDRSAETDANVLLRRHLGRNHADPPPARTRRRLRYVPYVIAQDATAEPEYEARCVSGDEADCGAVSGPHPDPAGVEEWQRRHTQDTRHTRYRRTFADYAVLERA
ncbi:hypothetical protein ACL02U_12640 [Streptomyces sp. MS06]|uniref:DUF7848 domain-containing protein n=1 Tax=Streptomyces sp. MS06 TaxID=3385974 RepID=UPI0039A019DB